jgi:hypothetical protein
MRQPDRNVKERKAGAASGGPDTHGLQLCLGQRPLLRQGLQSIKVEKLHNRVELATAGLRPRLRDDNGGRNATPRSTGASLPS